MNPPEQAMEGADDGVAEKELEVGKNENNDAVRIGMNEAVEGGTKQQNQERKQQQQHQQQQHDNEQEMIQKAISFWNHPAVRDVPSSEKRSYLRERQGLTDAQIHKVWEEIVVGSSRVGTKDHHNNIPNSPSMALQQRSGHSHQHYPHQYNSYQSPSSHPPPNSTAYEHYFHSKHQAALPSSSHISANYGYDQKQSPPFPPLPNDPLQEGDTSISVARGLSLLSVGGALGITGAAAVRWLNGGRFELFPATTLGAASNNRAFTNIESDQEGVQHGKQTNGDPANDEGKWNGDTGNIENEEDEYDEIDDYDDSAEYSDHDDDEELNMEECLLERMDALLSSIDSNSMLQEKLILKLANTSTITDDSMSLLKHNNKTGNKSSNSTTDTPIANSKTISKLIEVKDGVASLFHSMRNKLSANNDPAGGEEQDWEKDVSKLLTRFDDCIQALGKPVDSFVLDSDAADSKSISTSETSQTENQGRQDKQLSTPAPSTPAAGVSNQSRISSSDMTETLIPLSLNDCIRKLVEKNNPMNLKSGSQLLYLYLANLSGKPDNRRYRKIFSSNESFQKVENLVGGKDLLCAVGFVEESEKGILEWVPTGSTEEEISALILVKEAAAALGVLKKPDSIPSSELLESALSKLSASSLSFPVPPVPPALPPADNESESGNRNPEDIPQTPVGSSLLSPPMPKKMPFVPTPSDNLK